MMLLTVAVLFTACSSEPKQLGEKSGITPVLRVSEGFLPLNHYRQIAIQGRITTVCPDDGCWLAFTDDANVMRVEFPPSALPRGWAGKNVYAEGTIVETIIDPTSPGYDEYEQSCGISGTSSEGQRRRVSVFRATYLEIGG